SWGFAGAVYLALSGAAWWCLKLSSLPGPFDRLRARLALVALPIGAWVIWGILHIPDSFWISR
ncbi:MAG TPA: hypothetical protein VFM16_09515, partial [Holophagaceae bacterium]|nr:hypothetical protein [Holophagaceae bacterium]